MMASTLLYVMIASIAAANRVDFYRSCASDSVKTTLNYVDVTPCPKQPCGLPRNQNITVSISFRTKNEITSARPVVYANTRMVKLRNPFPLEQDACRNMACPVAPDTDVTYTTTIPIRQEYPRMTAVAQFELIDQADRTVVCIVIPVEVVD